MTTVLDRVRVVLQTDVGQFHSGLQGAERALASAGARMSQVGRDLTTRLTLPLAGVAFGATKAAVAFDDSLRKIAALTDTNVDQVQAWRGDVRALAVEYGSTAEAAADALFFITGAGITDNRALEALKASLMGTAIGLGETKVVADAATSAMNAYARSNLTATRATEILAAGVNYGKMEAAELAPEIGQLTGTAAALNISFADVVATLAVFSRTGTNASEGATQLSAIMSTLLGTSKEGEEVLAKHGLTLAMLRDVAAGPRGLINVMRLLNTAFAGQYDQLSVVIPNIRAFRGVMNALAQDSSEVDKVFAGVADSVGLLDQAIKDVEGPGLAMRRAWAQIKDALVEVGDVLVPVVVPVLVTLATLVQDLAHWFGDLNPQVQQVTIILAAFAAALGPILVLLGGLIQTISLIKLSGLISGFSSLGMMFGVGGALFVGLGLITGAWIQMRMEVARTEAATASAMEKMNAIFSGMSPDAARRGAERFGEVIENYEQKRRDLQATFDANETFLRQRLGNDVYEGKAFSLNQLDRPVRRAVRENDTIEERLADIDAQIELLKQRKAIMDAIVKAADDAARTAPGTSADTPTVTPVAPWVGETKTALEEFELTMKAVTTQEELLGDQFDHTEAQASAYREVIKALVAAGTPLDQSLNDQGLTLRELANRYKVLTKESTDAEQQQRDFRDAVSAARSLVNAARTPLEEYEEAVRQLTIALSAGAITQDEFNKAIKHAKEMLSEANAETSALQQGLQDLVTRAVDDFVDMAFEGSQSFEEFVRSALRDIAKLIVKIELMRWLVGEGFKGGEFGGILGGIGDWLGGLFGGGGADPTGVVAMAGVPALRMAPSPLPALQAQGAGEMGPALNVNVNVNAVDRRDVAAFFEENESLVAMAMVRAHQKSASLRRALGGEG